MSEETIPTGQPQDVPTPINKNVTKQLVANKVKGQDYVEDPTQVIKNKTIDMKLEW